MKAMRVHQPGGVEALRLDDVPDPEPGAGEALVKLDAIGLNFIEVYQRSGQYSVAPPFIPGTEAAGTVAAVGPGVTAVKVGDRVAGVNFKGSYAEKALSAADRLVILPGSVDSKTAAAAMLQGMTAHYLATSTFQLATGNLCLIHAAAGGVGLLLCQIARARGARIIATVSTPEKAALARDAGAHETVLYSELNFVEETRRLSDGQGVNVVYDSVGKSTFEGSLDCLRPRGMLVLFGQSSGPVPAFDPQLLNRKGSLFLTRPTLVHYVATREELLARSGDLFRWIGEGSLWVRIDRTYSLADAGKAHTALEGRQTTGKVLLIPERASAGSLIGGGDGGGIDLL
jgi:NADPH2:quinone reductase